MLKVEMVAIFVASVLKKVPKEVISFFTVVCIQTRIAMVEGS
jgi:hypothetical protein